MKRQWIFGGKKSYFASTLIFFLCLTTAPVSEAKIKLGAQKKQLRKEPVEKVLPLSIRESTASTGIDVFLDAPDLTEIKKDDKTLLEQSNVKRIGVRRRLPTPITVSSKQTTRGRWVDLKDGGSLWILTIQSAEAEAIRIHFEEVDLPMGARFMVYNTEIPHESYGPYHARSFPGGKDFWSESVFASKVSLECYVPPGVDPTEVVFQVLEIAHVYVRLSDVSLKVADCHLDVTCYFPEWENVAASVAGLGTIGEAGVVWCSGSLINDLDDETWEDYFLTANHCLSHSKEYCATQAEADTLEFYWLYQSPCCPTDPSCTWTEPNPANVPRTGGGADLLTSQTGTYGNDHCFLRIRNETPVGYYAGWKTEEPEYYWGTHVGIHHPEGSYKRISFGGVYATEGNYWKLGWVEGKGIVEVGSSGSPLFDADHLLIGQLYGGTTTCDAEFKYAYYGRFDVTYSSILWWLEVGGTIHVDGSYTGTERGTPSQPFNSLGGAFQYRWDGVRIKIQAGYYQLTYHSSLFGDITYLANGGTATFEKIGLPGQASLTPPGTIKVKKGAKIKFY